MKTAEEWGEHFMLEPMTDRDDGVRLKWDDIRVIQADALRHAAKICQDEGDMHSGPSPGCYDARDRIEAEANKLIK